MRKIDTWFSNSAVRSPNVWSRSRRLTYVDGWRIPRRETIDEVYFKPIHRLSSPCSSNLISFGFAALTGARKSEIWFFFYNPISGTYRARHLHNWKAQSSKMSRESGSHVINTYSTVILGRTESRNFFSARFASPWRRCVCEMFRGLNRVVLNNAMALFSKLLRWLCICSIVSFRSTTASSC